MKISLVLVADILVGNCCSRCSRNCGGVIFLVDVGLNLSCDWRLRSFYFVPLGIGDDTSDRDSGHSPTDPFAGLVGNLESLQAR